MIKVGVIGLGAIGQRLIKGFQEHPEMDIAAVCDAAEDRVKETADRTWWGSGIHEPSRNA